jgi:hypothetical protein
MSEPRTRPRAAIETICPHLGIEEDSQTCLAYPSGWNLCHRSQPASVVLLGHQKTTCLSPAYRSCPVSQNNLIAPLPVSLRGERRVRKKATSKRP